MDTRKKAKRTLVLGMGVLVLFVVFFSKWYYSNLNATVDPRIVPARELYEKYNSYTENNYLDSVFYLMDTIEAIYTSVDHYKEAFELGVLDNNRSAAWLTIALYSEYRDSTEKDSLVCLANNALLKSISLYEKWEDDYAELSQTVIQEKIKPIFLQGLESYETEKQAKYLENRVDEITNNQTEVDRRLSVSYTNLGMVYRYRVQYESAAECYLKALELWDRNLTAKNNLNLLMDKPMEKQNIIQKLFPPERIDK